jgi:hypothetical protein
MAGFSCTDFRSYDVIGIVLRVIASKSGAVASRIIASPDSLYLVKDSAAGAGTCATAAGQALGAHLLTTYCLAGSENK